jgi:hypothetical protein
LSQTNNFYNFDNKIKVMVIERTSKEVIIRLPPYVDTSGLQKLVDYLTYLEAISKSKAKQIAVDNLAKDVKKVGGLKIKVV